MAKKRKPAPGASRTPRPSQSPEPKSAPPAVPGPSLVAELFQHPMLVVGWGAMAITIFAIAAAIRFRDDLNMGAIREPTGAIMWAAITATSFASHWRQTRRKRNTAGTKPGAVEQPPNVPK